MASEYTAPGSGLVSDPLSRLPAELLHRITDYLNTTDLCAVRLCSRTIERSLNRFFFHEFLRRKQFMLTDFSLQALLAMARHPVISQTLRHVSISLHEFAISFRNVHARPEQAYLFLMAAAQQKSLLHTGRAVQLLAAAFSLLPNLETVEIRDTDSFTRYREGSVYPWRSYGYISMLEQLGDERYMELFTDSPDPDFVSRVFPLVLAALAQSTARPPNLEVLISRDLGGMKYSAFDLTPMPQFDVRGDSTGIGTGTNAFAVLTGLRSLHLCLQFAFHSKFGQRLGLPTSRFGRSDFSAPFKNAPSVTCLPIHAWLAHCPNLEWLRLRFLNSTCKYNETFLSALGNPLPASYPFPPGSMASRDITMPFASRLRRLDLGGVACSHEVLSDLLLRLPALEHLLLQIFSLKCSETSEQILHVQWGLVLAALSAEPLGTRLKHVFLQKLGVLTTSYPEPGISRFYNVSVNGRSYIDLVAEIDKPMSSLLSSVFMRVEKGMEIDDEDKDDTDDDSDFDFDDDDEDFDGEEEDEGV
ncbi:hypothetical protein SEPCBS57363_004001 [Sporothrix epigloea]|uniref:F-box domain-containing protein n=1 Tax=Sporothrix epigloea TaxID=1892477 RepID=A0ABP0DPV9_9PEZI